MAAEKSNTSDAAKGNATHPRTPYLHQTARFIQLLGETNEQSVACTLQNLPCLRVTTYLKGISGWKEYEAILDEEKKRYEELVSAKNLGTDDEANTFKPGQQ